jgi:hypothetical protein
MDFYLQRLQNAISSATAGLSVETLARRPGTDKWSIAEILEHLYLTYTGTIKGFEMCDYGRGQVRAHARWPESAAELSAPRSAAGARSGGSRREDC